MKSTYVVGPWTGGTYRVGDTGTVLLGPKSKVAPKRIAVVEWTPCVSDNLAAGITED